MTHQVLQSSPFFQTKLFSVFSHFLLFTFPNIKSFPIIPHPLSYQPYSIIKGKNMFIHSSTIISSTSPSYLTTTNIIIPISLIPLSVGISLSSTFPSFFFGRLIAKFRLIRKNPRSNLNNKYIL